MQEGTARKAEPLCLQQLSFKKLRRNQKPACNRWIFFTPTFYRMRMQMSTVHASIKDGSRWKTAYKARKFFEAIYVCLPKWTGRIVANAPSAPIAPRAASWESKNVERGYLRRDTVGHYTIISDSDDIAWTEPACVGRNDDNPPPGRKIQHKQAIPLYADHESLHDHIHHLQSPYHRICRMEAEGSLSVHLRCCKTVRFNKWEI